MAQHTGKIEGRVGSNILVCGKQYYVPPDKASLFEKFPEGSSVTLVEVKGTVSTITSLNGDATPGTTAATSTAKKVDTVQTAPIPAAEPKPIKEAHHEVPVPVRQASGNKEGDRIGWQTLLNTSVNIIDPSWRDDPTKTIHENISARLELVKATASGLHVFITEKLNGGA
jgi:hypothetical protein